MAEATAHNHRAHGLNRARQLILDAAQALHDVDPAAASRLVAEAERLNKARLQALAAGQQTADRAKLAQERSNALAEAARARAESERAAARAEQFTAAGEAAEKRATGVAQTS